MDPLGILVRANFLEVVFNSPLAAVLIGTGKNKVRYIYIITSALATKLLYLTATVAHGITSTKALAKFSHHLLRVEVCINMETTGKQGQQSIIDCAGNLGNLQTTSVIYPDWLLATPSLFARPSRSLLGRFYLALS